MPTFCCSSAAHEIVESLSVTLHARHVFTVGTTSEKVLNLKGRIPEEVDVILGSDLVFSLSGTLDSTKVTSAVLRQSFAAEHIVDYLRMNSAELGLSTVTGLYIDEDGRAKFTIISSRPLRAKTQPAAVQLVSIDIVIACKSSTQGQATEGIDPFATQAHLPLLLGINRLMGKFVRFHLVRRYPLIFGPWRARLDMEAAVFPSIVKSLSSIAERSDNTQFRREFLRYKQRLWKHSSFVTSRSEEILNAYLKTSETEADADIDEQNDDEVIAYALEQLFKLVVRPTLFKGSAIASIETEVNGHGDFAFDLPQMAFVNEESSFIFVNDAISDDEDMALRENLEAWEDACGPEFKGEDSCMADDGDSWPSDSLQLHTCLDTGLDRRSSDEEDSQLLSVSPRPAITVTQGHGGSSESYARFAASQTQEYLNYPASEGDLEMTDERASCYCGVDETIPPNSWAAPSLRGSKADIVDSDMGILSRWHADGKDYALGAELEVLEAFFDQGNSASPSGAAKQAPFIAVGSTFRLGQCHVASEDPLSISTGINDCVLFENEILDDLGDSALSHDTGTPGCGIADLSLSHPSAAEYMEHSLLRIDEPPHGQKTASCSGCSSFSSANTASLGSDGEDLAVEGRGWWDEMEMLDVD